MSSDTSKLGFQVWQDIALSESKRWVVLSVDDQAQTKLLLAKAAAPDQSLHVGNQTGGRVGFFLYSDDFFTDYQRMMAVKLNRTLGQLLLSY